MVKKQKKRLRNGDLVQNLYKHTDI